jgi:predicted PurR-regulated permease PerM
MKNNPWGLSSRYIAGIIVLAAVIALLIYAREAIKMLVIAAFVAYLISPAVTVLMHNTKLSRRAAVNIVYFSALIVLVGVPAVLRRFFLTK